MKHITDNVSAITPQISPELFNTMAMKKTEMESHWALYHDRVSKARAAFQGGLVKECIEFAVSSWEYVDGMMQFARKYKGAESVKVEGIEVVLIYAPALFDITSLQELESLLQGQRRIGKNAAGDLAASLAESDGIMWDAHRLWNYLEKHNGVRQDQLRDDLESGADRWNSIADVWRRCGLARRTLEAGAYRLELSTRLDQPTLAKCSACGVKARATKSHFLSDVTCPGCRKTVAFVLLLPESTAGV